mmetsp:Transcript_1401/g.6045  ORF Transcript_1401/g.6045 Transcript_1401/m.6045 type:complete len:165 (+) Transcript_1401:650-1144(+)|eukprot:scaffold895_cov315-Pinguiococcus_pyrenoidosus.AAC.23
MGEFLVDLGDKASKAGVPGIRRSGVSPSIADSSSVVGAVDFSDFLGVAKNIVSFLSTHRADVRLEAWLCYFVLAREEQGRAGTESVEVLDQGPAGERAASLETSVMLKEALRYATEAEHVSSTFPLICRGRPPGLLVTWRCLASSHQIRNGASLHRPRWQTWRR